MSTISIDTPGSDSAPAAEMASPSSEELRELALRMYLGTDEYKQIVSAERKKKSSAKRPLQKLALINTFFALALAILLQRHISMGDSRALLLVICEGAIAAAFWGLWAWSFFAALPAAIVGLLMYLSIISLEWASTPLQARGVSPLIYLFRVWVFAMLIKAIIYGSRERAAIADEAAAIAGEPKKPRSIASAIWLFVFLLSIVVIPRSLATDHDLTMTDYLDVLRLMAIFVVTWAILAWRDTLPAIRTIGSLGWLAMGVLCGLGTFAVASIWGDVSGYVFGMPPADVAAPLRAAGFGWLGVVGLVALYPAIFEELAFRGIILPCLNRALTIRESIAVSGMMFMILHLTVPSAPPLLLAGIGLGFIRIRSKSIWPGVAMHFTHNAMCIAIACWK